MWQLNETFTFDMRTITFFNQQGQAVSATIHWNIAGIITNSASGNTYHDIGHFQMVLDLTTGEETDVGVSFNTSVPGLGPVLHEVGKVIFAANGDITFIAGPHNVLLGTAPDICTVLL